MRADIFALTSASSSGVARPLRVASRATQSRFLTWSASIAEEGDPDRVTSNGYPLIMDVIGQQTKSPVFWFVARWADDQSWPSAYLFAAGFRVKA